MIREGYSLMLTSRVAYLRMARGCEDDSLLEYYVGMRCVDGQLIEIARFQWVLTRQPATAHEWPGCWMTAAVMPFGVSDASLSSDDQQARDGLEESFLSQGYVRI